MTMHINALTYVRGYGHLKKLLPKFWQISTPIEFDENVLRKFKMSPNKFKLSRARKVALLITHTWWFVRAVQTIVGLWARDEEEQSWLYVLPSNQFSKWPK
jgi:hypothetical protein